MTFGLLIAHVRVLIAILRPGDIVRSPSVALEPRVAVEHEPDADVEFLVLPGHLPPLRRHVAIQQPDLWIMSSLGFRLALLGPDAELFRVHHADPTRRTRPRLP